VRHKKTLLGLFEPIGYKTTVGFLLKLLFLCLLAYLLFHHWMGDTMGEIRHLRTHNPQRTAFMGDVRRPVDQFWVSMSHISVYLQRAVIVAEDGAFYNHHGVDFHELKESIKRNLEDQAFSRGFSTISMQLARNLFLSPDKDLGRKVREIIIALLLEWELGKQRILELYLNLIEWGPGIYGVEAAAHYYFKTSAANLSPQQAAFLAAIIPSPTRLGRQPTSPYVQGRIDVIMNRMQRRWGMKLGHFLPDGHTLQDIDVEQVIHGG
jgi:monofunctional biosynthetic peptidoglycan transglycosylase